jgi:hypothetical protein
LEAAGTNRTGRAVVGLAVAALAVLVAGIVYLGPGLAAAGASARPYEPSQPRPPAVVTGRVSFGDARHGMVELDSTRPTRLSSTTRYWTADGGSTWRADLQPPHPPGPSFVFFIGPRRVLSASTSRQRLSNDGGRTWRTITDPRRGPHDLASVPFFLDDRNGWWLDQLGLGAAPPGTSIALHPVGLWRTRDGGQTWAALAATGIPAAGDKTTIIFGDALHGVMELIPVSAPAVVPLSLLTTDDGGVTWRLALTLTQPLQDATLSFWTDFMRGARIVLTMLETPIGPEPSSLAEGPQRSFVFTTTSADDGATWGPVRAGPAVPNLAGAGGPITAALDEGGRLVLLSGRRMWSSPDWGATWAARVAVLPEGLEPSSSIRATPDAFFVWALPATSGLGSGHLRAPVMLRSRDGGIHWEPVPLPPAAHA